MSNNFPSVPTTNLVLTSVEYNADFGAASQGSPGALSFAGSTVQFGGALSGLANGSAVEYVFTTPGTFGSFDQTSAETAIKGVITAACNVLVAISGAPLATIQGMVTITRRWTWTDPTGNRATYTDTLAYP